MYVKMYPILVVRLVHNFKIVANNGHIINNVYVQEWKHYYFLT